MTVIKTPRLDLVSLTIDDLDAAIEGRFEALADSLRTVSGAWPGDPRFLGLYRDRLVQNPDWNGWLMRAIVLRASEREFAGHIGFHLGPNAEGSVEVGYTVFPAFRGTGVATEATAGLIAWARKQGVRKVIASIAPTNIPSLRVAEKLGFVQTGTQWDEEDGEELVFERRL